MAEGNRLSLNLDFGATASAVSFSVNDNHPIVLPTALKWDSAAEKQSRLVFVGPGESGDHGRGITLKNFKLLLYSNKHFQNERDKSIWQSAHEPYRSLGEEVSPEQLVGYYLSKLWTYAYGRLPDGVRVPKSDITTVLTHPFSDTPEFESFVAALRIAQKIAGFGDRIHFLREHEAAVQYIRRQPTLKMKGEALVVDCGGITIDAAYTNLTKKAQRQPHTSLGGGVLLDQLFEKLIRAKITETHPKPPVEHAEELLSGVMKEWHKTIKRDFTISAGASGTNKLKWAYGQALRLELSDTDIKGPFEAVAQIIMNVISLMEEKNLEHKHPQPPKKQHVVLTGGLSQSFFMVTYLRTHLGSGYEVEACANGVHAVVLGMR